VLPGLLNYLIFLPLFGAVLCLVAPSTKLAKYTAVGISGLTFVLSLLLFQHFAWWGGHNVGSVFGAHYGEKLYEVCQRPWIQLPSGAWIEYYVGVDGLSFPLVILTTFVSFLSCLASWNIETWKNNKGIRGFFALFLLLETGMIGVFVSLDFFLFYIFWEVMLLPMYFLIGVWGPL
jgi:NADH-quinone oxidoreductase subunit M